MSIEGAEQVIIDANGLQRTLGYKHYVFADRCETHLDIDERHTNRHGTLHGGLHATILDSALGFAASRAVSDDASQLVYTVSLTTQYLAAAKGNHVKAIGRTTRAGRSIIYAQGEVVDDTGQVLATGTGVFKKASK